jgi:hypothetical protein
VIHHAVPHSPERQARLMMILELVTTTEYSGLQLLLLLATDAGRAMAVTQEYNP